MPNLKQYKQQLANNRHRGVVVIAGQQQQTIAALNELIDDAQLTDKFWLGSMPHAFSNYQQINPKQAQHKLGQQCNQLVINAHDGIDLNALGALAGTVKAGGLCIILTPELALWPNMADPKSARFNAYDQKGNEASCANRIIKLFLNVIESEPDIVLIEPAHSELAKPELKPHKYRYRIPQLQSQLPSQSLPTEYLTGQFKTAEQQQAVTQILKVVSGHRRRPLVITADRGRGKSAALGLAAKALIAQGKQRIIITAPNKHCVETVFAHATESCDNPAPLVFIPIDELIATKPSADLVMVDEAAAISAPLLTQLLTHYSRIVFTSTIAGYEGTGRGFEIRFKQRLNELTPNHKTLHMNLPIRFAPNDILERFINNALLLNANATQINQASSKKEAQDKLSQTPQFTHWNRDQLLDDHHALTQIFALLTLAHYKTSPNDLRHMLDGNNIEVFSLAINQQIIAVGLIAIEGKLDATLSQAISQGSRRVKGHLLPQSLSYHAQVPSAAHYRYARVMRIAVHPDIHQQGIGSQFLTALTAHYQQQAFDFIGASFGAQSQLISFWQTNQFKPVRLGLTLEGTSNEYSLMVLKSLSADGNHLLQTLTDKFSQQLPQQLLEFCPALDGKVICQLLSHNQNIKNIDQPLQQAIVNFTQHSIDYECCAFELYQWLQCQLAVQPDTIAQLSAEQCQLLTDKIMRKKSWSQICQQQQINGKKQAQAALKHAITQLID